MRRTNCNILIVMVLYAFVAVSLLGLDLQTLDSTLPVENETLSTVALFNAWTIWWNADRISQGFRGYWDAPIFFPEPNTFAFSEPQPATLLVAPVIWITGSRVLAYKAYLLLSLTLNGFVAAVLLRRKTGFWIAALGGLAMLLLPAVHMNIGVLQLVPLWGALWTWDAVDRLTRTPSLGRGAETGLAFSCVWLTCLHHGLFLTVLLASSGWVLLRNWKSQRFALAISLALLVTAGLTGPVALKVRSTAQHNDFTRDSGLVQRLSATPLQYCYTAGRFPLSLWTPAAHSRRLSPGWIKLALACACLGICLWRRKCDRWILFLACMGTFAFLLSLGPHLQIGFWKPWWTLVDWIPGMAQVRSVYRFSYFVQMGVVLLAMHGLHALWIMQRRVVHRTGSRRLVRILFVCLGVGAVLESIPVRPMLAGVPDHRAHKQWIEFIRQETPPSKGIACFPFSAGHLVEDFDVTARWMYFGTFHGKPIVNGYSGFFPESYNSLKKAVNSKFPSQETLQQLQQREVEFVVVMRRRFSIEQMRSANTPEVSLHPVFQDPVGVDVYQLRSSGSPIF